MRPEVLTDLGGFSGALSMNAFKIWRSRPLFQEPMAAARR